MRLEDNPAYINYPGENGKVVYGEGIFVGYRYYEKKKVAPLFPFGFGLSYTSFAYKNLRLSASQINPADTLLVSVDVANTGARPGQEVVQLYVSDPASKLVRPEKELKAFAKVALQPGETRTVTLALTQESLAYYDDLDKKWVAEEGEFRVLLGSSSQEIHLSAAFQLTQTARSGGLVQAGGVRFDRHSKLQDMLASQEARDVLEKHFPGVLDMPELTMAAGYSLDQIAGMVPDLFSPQKIQEVLEDLAKI
jgi:beta-glucosidase